MYSSPVLLDVREELGAGITSLIAAVVRGTERDDLDAAAHTLNRKLARNGIRADNNWCRGVLERLRRGDPVTIEME